VQDVLPVVCSGLPAMGEMALMGRLNVKLEMKGVEPMQDLVKDFSDGVKLIQLLVSWWSLVVSPN